MIVAVCRGSSSCPCSTAKNASFEKVYAEIRDSLSAEAIPVEVPIGSGDDFKGIVNLFSMKAHMYKPGAKKGEYEETDVPEELAATVESYREQLIENGRRIGRRTPGGVPRRRGTRPR